MGAENISLGTCKIIYGDPDVPAENSRELGLTIGGVEVEVTTSTYESNVDQFGDTIVSETITGRNVMVRVPMAETTVENLADIMPGATLVTDSVDATVQRVDVETGIGINLRDTAKMLILHPIDKPDSDKSEDFVVPLAATPGGINFAYKIDEERVYMAEFKGYPNTDGTGILFYYGDPAATP